MKISTKTLIVVLVCLLGALLAATSILASYQSREDARKNNELSVLALRDVRDVRAGVRDLPDLPRRSGRAQGGGALVMRLSARNLCTSIRIYFYLVRSAHSARNWQLELEEEFSCHKLPMYQVASACAVKD